MLALTLGTKLDGMVLITLGYSQGGSIASGLAMGSGLSSGESILLKAVKRLSSFSKFRGVHRKLLPSFTAIFKEVCCAIYFLVC